MCCVIEKYSTLYWTSEFKANKGKLKAYKSFALEGGRVRSISYPYTWKKGLNVNVKARKTMPSPGAAVSVAFHVYMEARGTDNCAVEVELKHFLGSNGSHAVFNAVTLPESTYSFLVGEVDIKDVQDMRLYSLKENRHSKFVICIKGKLHHVDSGKPVNTSNIKTVYAVYGDNENAIYELEHEWPE